MNHSRLPIMMIKKDQNSFASSCLAIIAEITRKSVRLFVCLSVSLPTNKAAKKFQA